MFYNVKVTQAAESIELLPENNNSQSAQSIQIGHSNSESCEEDKILQLPFNMKLKKSTKREIQSPLAITLSKKCYSNKYLGVGKQTLDFQQNKKLSRQNSEKRLKLRDYLYLAKTSSKQASKNLHQEKKFQNSGLFSRMTDQEQSKLVKKSKIKKDKYSINNSQMCQIVTKEISDDLLQIEKQTLQLKNHMVEQFKKQTGQPSNEQMVEMYDVRRKIKEQVLKSIKELNENFRKNKELMQDMEIRQTLKGASEKANVKDLGILQQKKVTFRNI